MGISGCTGISGCYGHRVRCLWRDGRSNDLPLYHTEATRPVWEVVLTVLAVLALSKR
jgi:hypothetical protein